MVNYEQERFISSSSNNTPYYFGIYTYNNIKTDPNVSIKIR